MRRFVFYTLLTMVLVSLAACGGSSSVTKLQDTTSKATQMLFFPLPEDGPNSNMVYLVDNPADNSDSNLYEVRFDTINGQANMTLLATLDGFTDAHIGTTWDGKFVYAVNQSTSEIGVYDVDADTWTVIENGGQPVVIKNGATKVNGIVLVTFRPDGVMYVASQNTDQLYTVDTTTGAATSLGNIYPYGYWPPNNGPEIMLSGADITFDVTGNLYLYTNKANNTVPKGLYWVDYAPTDPTLPCQAAAMDYLADDTITGMALTLEGWGDLCVSLHNANTIDVVNRGSFNTTSYPLMLDGQPFDHHWGDLAMAFGSELGYDDPDDPGTGGYECSKTVNLMAGQNMLAGEVAVELNADGQLTVNVDTAGDWTMDTVHLYVGLEPPTDSAPGQFPYVHDNQDVTSDTFVIDMIADFPDWEPGVPVYIALHAETEHPVKGCQTAWGEGEPFGTSWAMYFTLDCEAQDCHYEGWQRPLLVRNCEAFDAGMIYGEPDCDNGRLLITIEMTSDWLLDQAYVYVSANEPTGVLPDNMFYHLNLNGATEDMFSIDVMNDVPGFECGDTLYIAVETIIFHIEGDGSPVYATDVLNYHQGTRRDGAVIEPARSNPLNALGAPDGPGIGSFFSLGFDLTSNTQEGGFIDLGFGQPVYNGPGADVNTIEITWNRYSDQEELAAVYVVDRDGVEHFCGIASNFDGDGSRTGISHLSIPDGLNFLEFVRLVDVTDINKQSPADDGYDIDAVSVNFTARYKAAFSWHGDWKLWFPMYCVPGGTNPGDDDDGDGNGDDDGYACAMTTSLLAGQHMLAGSVFAGITPEGELTVIMTTLGDWAMDTTHLYVGTEAPTNSAPGQFPYSHVNSGVTTDTYTIDMSQDFPDWELGDPIYIATHADAHHPYLGGQTAWGEGTPFGTSWAMYIKLHCQ